MEWTVGPLGAPTLLHWPIATKAVLTDGATFSKQRKTTASNSAVGITYMLAGATQRSDSDPYDKTSPPITVGPKKPLLKAPNLNPNYKNG
jgi:hypothetical protein